MRMRHIVIRSLPGCKIFFHIIDNFRKEVTEYDMYVCFDFLCNFLSETLLIPRIQPDIPVVLVRFRSNLNLIYRFSKI
jgi:hypothetical protein